jgi:hypothetical protein
MDRKDEERRSSAIGKLLIGMASPFTKWIANFKLLDKFKPPQILSFTGIEDPIEHLANFQTHIDLYNTPDEVTCRTFPLNLSVGVRDWFRILALNSIGKFKDLSKKFLVQFLATQVRNNSSHHLLAV